MSDTRGRELERAWRRTGTDHELSAWLRHRHVHGSVTERALVASAYLGCLGARDALSPEAIALHPMLATTMPQVTAPENRLFVAMAMLDPVHWRGTLIALKELWILGGEPGHDADVDPVTDLVDNTVSRFGDNGDRDAMWDVFQWVVMVLFRGPVGDTPGNRRLLNWADALKGVRDKLVPVLLGLD